MMNAEKIGNVVEGVEEVAEVAVKAGPKMISVVKATLIAGVALIGGFVAGVGAKVGYDKVKDNNNNAKIEKIKGDVDTLTNDAKDILKGEDDKE